MEIRNFLTKYFGPQDSSENDVLNEQILADFDEINFENILVVDDDDDMLRLIKRQLECMPDYHAISCKNELETLEEITNTDIEVGIIDVNLEALSGYRLGDYIRYLKKKDVPFIFISSDRDKLTELNVLKIENCQFLHKPFSRKELVAAIRKSINKVGA